MMMMRAAEEMGATWRARRGAPGCNCALSRGMLFPPKVGR